jgi:Leucine Rich repeat
MVHREGSNLDLSGAPWAFEESIRELKAAVLSTRSARSESSKALERIQLKDFDIDIPLAAIVVSLLRSTRTVNDLVLDQCSGHVDIVLTVALASIANELESLSIVTRGRGTTPNFFHSLGVGLQVNSTLTTLKLQACPDGCFALSRQAAHSLEHGMTGNSTLTTFHLVNCRFEGRDAIQALSRGMQSLRSLRDVRLRSCFASNGHPLDDDSISILIRGLQHNAQLTYLDLSRGKCLQRSLSSLSTLMDGSQLRSLDLSYQYIDREDEPMDLSSLVAALGRTSTLQSLELRFNKLTDRAMAFLAAALTYNTSIQYVGLAGNNISNLGISILSSKIASMPVLQNLILTSNGFDVKGARELVTAMKENFVLRRVECDPVIPCFKTIRYYADLNWSGRRFFRRRNGGIPIQASLWPVVLARVSNLGNDKNDKKSTKERQAGVLFYLVRKGRVLFPCDVSTVG